MPFVIVSGGHQGSVWRAALPPMLAWMTPQLAQAAKAGAAEAAPGSTAQPQAPLVTNPASSPAVPRKK